MGSPPGEVEELPAEDMVGQGPAIIEREELVQGAVGESQTPNMEQASSREEYVCRVRLERCPIILWLMRLQAYPLRRHICKEM